MKNKKEWLDKLYYNVGKQNFDFEICGTYIKKDGNVGFTKWIKYSKCIFPIDFDGTSDDWKAQKFFEQTNQRQIFPNEIVLDIEQKEGIDNIIKNLNDLKVKYYLFSTESRGYHIHIFFKKEVSQNKKLALIKKFGADEMKDKEKVLISLEYAPHWKSGKLKEKIEWK